MKKKLFLAGMISLALTFGLVLTSCGGGEEDPATPNTPGDPNTGDPDTANQLPPAIGTNALSGKTYFDRNKKIVFSATDTGAANGTYTIRGTIWNPTTNQYELESGKYKYTDAETGRYTWNADTKTVTCAPQKVAVSSGGTLKTKTEFRPALQTYLDEYIAEAEIGEEAFLAAMGFSSVSEFIDAMVAAAFENVTLNYAFSADAKALFLDEPLPANKGSNNLSGETYHGVTREGEPTQTYVFTADTCTYTSGGSTQIYDYAYDSTEKRVYLKTPTTNREDQYASSSPGIPNYFSTTDDQKAAWVNDQYSELSRYRYDTTAETVYKE